MRTQANEVFRMRNKFLLIPILKFKKWKKYIPALRLWKKENNHNFTQQNENE